MRLGADGPSSAGRLTPLALRGLDAPRLPTCSRACATSVNDMRVVLEVVQADVTRLEVDPIANAANTDLVHSGGVAAAISRAGGPAVQEESRERAPIRLGEAVATTAGDMPSR